MRIYLILLFFVILTPLSTVAENCNPTPHRSTGTHYKPVTVEKVNVSKGVTVKGRVLSEIGCKPIANAKIAHWQGSENGRYEDYLYAYMFTDEEGRYEFETEWPNMPIPHIHFIVTAKGFNTLETQWIGDQRQKVIEFDMVVTKK